MILKSRLSHLLSLTLLTALLFGCINTYNIRIIKDPELNIPSNIKNIGIFNRTIPHENTVSNTKIDEILSLEGLTLDRKGSQAAVSHLNTLLGQKTRFENSKLINHISDTTVYLFEQKPAPITWDKVNVICQENGLDGLIVLESYDTESSFTQSSAPVTKEVPLVGPVTTTQYYINVKTQIKAFWRIYNYKDQTIGSNITYNEFITTRAEGISILAAYNAVKGREQNVINKSHQISRDISNKMEPSSYWASRDYYSGGTPNLKAAKKRVETSSWDEAKSLWELDRNHPKDKIKGRAFYNLAHWAEVKGDLDKAIEYATEAYHISGNRQALTYINVLKKLKNKR